MASKHLKGKRGFFLTALLMEIALVTVLSGGAMGCYFTIVKMHRDFVSRMVMQEQLRFAAGHLLKDIANAETVEIKGQKLFIHTGENTEKEIVYEVKGENLMKDGQPVTGGDKDSAIAILQFSCKKFHRNVILICLKARNKKNSYTFTIETAGIYQPAAENNQKAGGTYG